MKPIKKTTAVAGKAPISSASLLKKFKSPLNINLPVTRGASLNGSEISIKVEAEKIIVRFLHKGEEVSQQAVTVKKTPAPPWPKDDVIRALEQLRLSFNIQD